MIFTLLAPYSVAISGIQWAQSKKIISGFKYRNRFFNLITFRSIAEAKKLPNDIGIFEVVSAPSGRLSTKAMVRMWKENAVWEEIERFKLLQSFLGEQESYFVPFLSQMQKCSHVTKIEPLNHKSMKVWPHICSYVHLFLFWSCSQSFYVSVYENTVSDDLKFRRLWV